MELLAASLIINVISIVVCMRIARKRGTRPVFWGIMGALFGPFAIPFALIAKPGNR